MDVMFFNKRSARLALQPGQGTVNPQRLEIWSRNGANEIATWGVCELSLLE